MWHLGYQMAIERQEWVRAGQKWLLVTSHQPTVERVQGGRTPATYYKWRQNLTMVSRRSKGPDTPK